MRSEWAERHDGHERYEQLIAFYSTGELTDAQVHELAAHLRVCESCREGLREYRTLFRHVGPTLFSSEELSAMHDDSWAPELKKRVLTNFAQMQRTSAPGRNRATVWSSAPPNRLSSTFKTNAILGTICILLIAAGVMLAKRNALIRSKNNQFTITSTATANSPLESKAAGAEEQSARLKIDGQDRTQLISSLARHVKEQQSQIAELNSQISHLQQQRNETLTTQDQLKSTNFALSREQQNLANKLHEEESSLAIAQQQLRDLQSEHAADLVETAHERSELADLKAQLHDRDSTIEQQQQLLASDRDIRELMGARELTIAEISDFDQNAQKRKPFGRVFFTKDRSLVFYAFDLDKQRGLQKASAFQAWGVSSSNRSSALNLGILYKDSESNRRWTLKFDDPEILAKIDAIFVTIEPNGGSLKPSGKQLLYAYLRTQPNHP